MSSKPNSTPATTEPLVAQLRDEIAKAIPAAKLVDAKNGRYFTVKVGTKTLGYVNTGARVVRVDFPQRGDERPRTTVSKKSEIARVVKQLGTYVPAIDERESKSTKTTKTPAKRGSTKSTKTTTKPGPAKLAAVVSPQQ